MDIHHVGQLVDAEFESSVGFYRDTLGLPLCETTDGSVRVAFFELPSAEFHLIVREERGSPADELLDTIGRCSAAHVAFAGDDGERVELGVAAFHRLGDRDLLGM